MLLLLLHHHEPPPLYDYHIHNVKSKTIYLVSRLLIYLLDLAIGSSYTIVAILAYFDNAVV
jgi:hypothetical protein